MKSIHLGPGCLTEDTLRVVGCVLNPVRPVSGASISSVNPGLLKRASVSSVPVLKKFKNLKTLDLKGVPAKATADEIRKALPGCKVIAQ